MTCDKNVEAVNVPALRSEELSRHGRVPTAKIGIQTLTRDLHRPQHGSGRVSAAARDFFFLKMTLRFKSGDTIPESGLYKVHHAQHRLPHQVTLLEGQTFPPCAKCRDEVRFELVRVLPALARERRGCVSLYALPVLEDEEAPDS
jgi:hypothetical protein